MKNVCLKNEKMCLTAKARETKIDDDIDGESEKDENSWLLVKHRLNTKLKPMSRNETHESGTFESV